MSSPSLANILRKHVALSTACLDRLYLNGYVPTLQTGGQLTTFLRDHLGFPVPSPAVIRPLHDRFVQAVESFAAQPDVPVMQFERDQCKDDVAATYRAASKTTKASCSSASRRKRPAASSAIRPPGRRAAPSSRSPANWCTSSTTTSIAPRGAWSYPRRSQEEHEGRFLGPMANPDPKGERDNRMPEKRRSGPGAGLRRLRDPCDMAKAELLEPQSPDDEK